MELKGKNILITGGSSGLGFSLAQKLIGRGCLVKIIGRSQENLNEAAKKINSPNFEALQCDVSKYIEVQKVVSGLDVDVLINNAGVWLEGTVDNNDPIKISETIDINLKGVIFTTKEILPKMLKKNDGFILNVVSTSGLKPREGQSVYVASKFGVTGFTKSLDLDLAKTNIKVSCFFPGGMNTNLFDKAGTPKDNKDWMNPDLVADVIVFMLERDESMIVSHLELNKRGVRLSNK
ncbi:MAG: SDR family oxidoreductase [bacterium]|nr:SDR family oxidoreductase [bacterium]